MYSPLRSLLNGLNLDLFSLPERREHLTPAMQDVLERLVAKIQQAAIDPVPEDNIFIENVFREDVYQKILTLLPADCSYDYLQQADAILPDGTRTRKLLDLTDETLPRFEAESRAFWRDMKAVFTSRTLQRAITKKFHSRLRQQYGNKWPEMVSVPLFYRDLPGYRIRIHPDATSKIATMQFYFPKDDTQIHLGTSFHVKDDAGFKHWKTNEFKPNSAYAFVRSSNSWHSVTQMGPHESARDTLALTIYKKGSEYKSQYDTGEK